MPRIRAGESHQLDRMEVQGVFDPVIRTLDGYAWMQNTFKFDTLKRVVYNQPSIEVPTRVQASVYSAPIASILALRNRHTSRQVSEENLAVE